MSARAAVVLDQGCRSKYSLLHAIAASLQIASPIPSHQAPKTSAAVKARFARKTGRVLRQAGAGTPSETTAMHASARNGPSPSGAGPDVDSAAPPDEPASFKVEVSLEEAPVAQPPRTEMVTGLSCAPPPTRDKALPEDGVSNREAQGEDGAAETGGGRRRRRKARIVDPAFTD